MKIGKILSNLEKRIITYKNKVQKNGDSFFQTKKLVLQKNVPLFS